MISKASTREDIGKYLATQTGVLVEDNYFPPKTKPQSLVHHMLKGADGRFLWARLMIGYLKPPALTPSRRLREVSAVKLPEELAKMYRRIKSLIE